MFPKEEQLATKNSAVCCCRVLEISDEADWGLLTGLLKSPKVNLLSDNAKVALTIDSTTWPYHVLSIRGIAKVEIVNGVAPEYVAAAKRYFGEEQGNAWVQQVSGMFAQMARISVKPEWVSILDFETPFPTAIEAAMAGF